MVQKFTGVKKLNRFKRTFSRSILFTLLTVAGLILLVYLLHNPSIKSPAQKSFDLLHGMDWSHQAGATQDSSGVHITSLGRAIVNQDGSGGQPNPPVNVRGPHLSVKGDFEIRFQ